MGINVLFMGALFATFGLKIQLHTAAPFSFFAVPPCCGIGFWPNKGWRKLHKHIQDDSVFSMYVDVAARKKKSRAPCDFGADFIF